MDEIVGLLMQPRNYVLHIAIALIAIVLISTLIYEMKKPVDKSKMDEDTKRINEILKD